MIIYSLGLLNLKSVLVKGEHTGPHAAVMGILFQPKIQWELSAGLFQLPPSLSIY